jgi:enoyl-ACP reductase-like protein
MILNITWVLDRPHGQAFYEVVKNATNKLTEQLADDLRPHGIACVAVSPGFMRLERMDLTPEVAAKAESAILLKQLLEPRGRAFRKSRCKGRRLPTGVESLSSKLRSGVRRRMRPVLLKYGICSDLCGRSDRSWLRNAEPRCATRHGLILGRSWAGMPAQTRPNASSVPLRKPLGMGYRGSPRPPATPR